MNTGQAIQTGGYLVIQDKGDSDTSLQQVEFHQAKNLREKMPSSPNAGIGIPSLISAQEFKEFAVFCAIVLIVALIIILILLIIVNFTITAAPQALECIPEIYWATYSV